MKIKFYLTYCLLFILYCLLVTGCAGITFSGLEDADTLGKGHSAITVGANMAIEGKYQFALSDKTDAGISLWNTSILNSLNPFKKFDQSEDGKDIGLKLTWKQLLSKKNSKHKFALTASVFGYTSFFKISSFPFAPIITEEYNYSALGFTPGFIYSYSFNNYDNNLYNENKSGFLFPKTRSIYAGLKINYLAASTSIFNTQDSTKASYYRPMVFPMPFVGFSIGGDNLVYCVEFIYLTRNFITEKNIKPAVYATAGIKFIFDL